MSGIRFQIGLPRVGSAARQSEEEHEQAPSREFPRIRAGSSARMAEDARRAEARGGDPAPAAPSVRAATGFSLRAEGGRITRTAAQPHEAHHTPPPFDSADAAKTAPVPFHSPLSPTLPPPPPAAVPAAGAQPGTNPGTNPEANFGSKLHSMFRRLITRSIPSHLPE